jgi:hypothetical protein
MFTSRWRAAHMNVAARTMSKQAISRIRYGRLQLNWAYGIIILLVRFATPHGSTPNFIGLGKTVTE